MNIFEAAKTGNCAEILKHTNEVDVLDEEGNTAMMVAAARGQTEVINTLVQCGAKLNGLGKGMNSALALACKGGHTESAQVLVNAGADTNTVNEDGQTSLHLAATGGYEAIAILLLDHGADIIAVDKMNKTPLFIAALKNVHHRMIALLLERGANPNYRNSGGNIPLIEAAYNGDHQSVKLLLQYGADPNIFTCEAGNSALYWASQKKFYTIAKALLDAGANPSHLTKSGNSAVSTAPDEMMKHLICTYTAGGPSWLVQQLCARGLEWPTVCDVEDKLLKEGFVTKELLLAAPMSLFTHEYLRSLGILQFGTRVAVITVRLEGTWLGELLAALGVSAFWIRSCETCVFEALGCRTKTAYANLPLQALSAEALKEVGVPAQYHLVLRVLHEQLNRAREEEKQTSTTAASSNAPNSSTP